MGYAREKEKIAKKRKRIWLISLVVLALFISAICVLMSISNPTTWKYKVFLPDVTERGEGELRVHFIDVRQGDATLIELPDGKTMLIDGGNGDDNANKSLLRHINALDIEKIDYLVLTHADNDHFGGLIELLKQKRVERAFLPITTMEEEKSSPYSRFLTELDKEDCAVEKANVFASLALSNQTNYTLAFLYPYTSMTDGVVEQPVGNDASVVVWLEYKNVSFLFTGDATKETETRLIASQEKGLYELYGVDIRKTKILKVAHHGSDDSTSEEFLNYIGVEETVISCGEDNPYGHPDKAVLERLMKTGAKIHRTDTDGSIIVTVGIDGAYRFETLDK
jgi:competence protein ComEC